MTTDAALLELWLTRHDDDTPDSHATSMTVDTRTACGVDSDENGDDQ